MFDVDPVLHPDDAPDMDEAGPWLALLVVSVLVWTAFSLVEWRLLSDGTLLWATAKNFSTLLFAPLTAAVLLQDTRALGVDGVEFGPLKWLYAGVALFFPPVGGRLPLSPSPARRSTHVRGMRPRVRTEIRPAKRVQARVSV